ncbi:hypothetical protein J5N97_018468 [Dioscorea zingiberensis]|uniref:Uncharacterized protein n=1 Tax=Dioscorea zingiberensis TaxID=325984 RepID=A0A9D5HHE3_9LILI|nr:hypothetical protein J5N97_018468 [Dioscorea zingiberensis]
MSTITTRNRRGLEMGLLVVLLVVVLLVTAATATSKVGAVLEEDTGEADRAAEGSWTSWAKERISEGLGFKQQEEEEETASPNKISDLAKTAKDKTHEMTSDSTGYHADKAGEVRDASEQASSAAVENAKQAAKKAQEVASGVCMN